LTNTSSPNGRRRRAWLTFKLSTLFLIVTVVAVVLAYPRIQHQLRFQKLKSYVGKDLRTLPEMERTALDQIIKRLLHSSKSDSDAFIILRYENWFVWELPTNKGTRFVIFQGQPIFMIPGTSNANIALLGPSGRLIAQSEFSTGWRIDISDAKLLPNRIRGESVIQVDSHPVINGGDVARQFYGVVGDRVVLLRLEDSNAECIPNYYAAPNHTIGPDAPPRTEDEWLRCLEDSKSAEILSSLVWVGGQHGRPIQNPGNVAIEDVNQATTHLKVREHPKTKHLLKALV
jgi:hypothetical protein